MKNKSLNIWIKNPIAKINIIILFALFFSGCLSKPQILDVSTQNFSFNKSKISLDLIVNVNNDNFFGMTFEKFNLKIYLNDEFLTSLNDSTPRKIKANSYSKLELPLVVKYNEMMNNMGSFMNIILGQKAFVRIEGTLEYKVLFVRKVTHINKITQIN